MTLTPEHCDGCGEEMFYGGFFYVMCVECGHLWETAAEFLAHWRSMWENNEFISLGEQQELMTVKASEVFVCPCCSHDL